MSTSSQTVVHSPSRSTPQRCASRSVRKRPHPPGPLAVGSGISATNPSPGSLTSTRSTRSETSTSKPNQVTRPKPGVTDAVGDELADQQAEIPSRGGAKRVGQRRERRPRFGRGPQAGFQHRRHGFARCRRGPRRCAVSVPRVDPAQDDHRHVVIGLAAVARGPARQAGPPSRVRWSRRSIAAAP